jgi:hypothetical protein
MTGRVFVEESPGVPSGANSSNLSLGDDWASSHNYQSFDADLYAFHILSAVPPQDTCSVIFSVGHIFVAQGRDNR